MDTRPNIIVIVIDDLRWDELGVTGHPYMKTPHIDRLAREGARFTNAFHTTPLCSPNRACILTGQYASRHGIIDNVGRDVASHRLPTYPLALQKIGYETAHVGKWHMGNDASPRPGNDYWVSFRGQGKLVDPELQEDGRRQVARGYVTDLLNERALAFVERPRQRPFALYMAHKAVHPDVFQRQDGTIDPDTLGGYVPAERHRDLYRGAVFPPRPNVLPPDVVGRTKPALAEALARKEREPAGRPLLDSIHAGSQEEIRLRAAMMASVDEGVGLLLGSIERSGALDRTLIVFVSDNGYFFGEHGLGPERRFAYEDGIRSPLLIRYPPLARPGTTIDALALALDIAPTVIEVAGGTPGPHIQGRSLVPLLRGERPAWRSSFLVEYYGEAAIPWLVAMSYKAVRTTRYKYIDWTQHPDCDELYDLATDPYELANLAREPGSAALRAELRTDLHRLVAESFGL
ncbi:MAG TPA: sulfatase [Methylomirabilota bacterium]|jgi:arylsulfatase A-like enzyme|nr:sulfatase [Methylomirabilota bacterium]